MFIVSEIFPQHSGDLDLAKRMILQSYINGASAVKFQLVENNMFSNDSLDRSHNEINFEELKNLTIYSRTIGIEPFATAFTEKTLEWCNELKFKYLKIPARMHSENKSLVKKILEFDKTIFISIRPTEVDQIKIEKKKNYIFLLCISEYPTLLSNVVIPDFNNSIFQGISDHSLGISAAIKSSSLGGKYLEKHFTFDKNLQKLNEKGHLGAMDSKDLLMIKKLTTEIELIGVMPKKI